MLGALPVLLVVVVVVLGNLCLLLHLPRELLRSSPWWEDHRLPCWLQVPPMVLVMDLLVMVVRLPCLGSSSWVESSFRCLFLFLLFLFLWIFSFCISMASSISCLVLYTTVCDVPGRCSIDKCVFCALRAWQFGPQSVPTRHPNRSIARYPWECEQLANS